MTNWLRRLLSGVFGLAAVCAILAVAAIRDGALSSALRSYGFAIAGDWYWLAFGTSLAAVFGLAAWRIAPSRSGRVAQRSIPGDGTNSLLNRFVWILGLVLGALAVQWWAHWSEAQKLPMPPQTTQVLWFFPILAVATVAHQLGHALAALTVEMRVSSLVLGPLLWEVKDGRIEFSVGRASMRSYVGGAVGIASTWADEPRWYRVWVALAGPLANLFMGVAAFVLALTAKNSSYESHWTVLADLSTISAGMFVLNMIPLRVGRFYSDGARIFQMLSGGMWSDYHRAFAQVSSIAVTHLRPRDYDLACMERLARTVPEPTQAVVYWLYQYECRLDRGEMAAAAEAVNAAERVSVQAEGGLTPELCAEFVYSMALLHGDRDRARAWWNRLESFRPWYRCDYWLAHSALHWIEGDYETARSSWDKGNDLAGRLPRAGAYEFDRHRFALLREAMDEVPVSAAAAGLLLS